MKIKSKIFPTVRALTLAAMLAAMSVVIGIFCKSFLDFGGGLYRITFENLPIILSGILFGPVVGGLVGAASDLVSYLLSPQIYPPNLIVTAGAFAVGLVSGLVAKFVGRKHGSLQIVLAGGLAHVVGSMIIKPIGLYQFYGLLVLWRIPLYLVIAPIEILLLCYLFRRKAFRKLVAFDVHPIKHKKGATAMTYEEALEYIHSINWTFCKPGLERISTLCEKLGDPQKKIKFIHVAGTNGKGSFCAMLSSILTAAGYKTGLYTSPYIKEFNERMAIDGEMISNEELAALTEYIRPFADAMEDKPTEFELITAIAFEYFARHECDFVVLECGLGGRLDSTNIIEAPALSVITGVALDHTAILGDTIAKIAAEKAGIIKEGCPVLFGNNSHEPDAFKVIKECADAVGAPLTVTDESLLKNIRFSVDSTLFDFEDGMDYTLPLLGIYQPYNAATVLHAVKALREAGFEISDEAVREGLKKVTWPARFERLSSDPIVIYDGGHNPQGIAAAKQSIETYFGNERILLLTGVMGDKDYTHMVKELSAITSQVYTVTPDNPRSLPATDLAEVYRKEGVKADHFDSLEDAVRAAMFDAKAQNRPLFILGSLYLYCEVYKLVETCSHNI